MFWEIVISILVIQAAWFLSVLPITQTIIPIRFGLPFTRKLKSSYPDEVNDSAIRKALCKTVAFWCIIIAVAVFAIVKWVPAPYSLDAAIGAGIGLLTSFKKCGENPDNISSYADAYRAFLSPELCEFIKLSIGG